MCDEDLLTRRRGLKADESGRIFTLEEYDIKEQQVGEYFNCRPT